MIEAFFLLFNTMPFKIDGSLWDFTLDALMMLMASSKWRCTHWYAIMPSQYSGRLARRIFMKVRMIILSFFSLWRFLPIFALIQSASRSAVFERFVITRRSYRANRSDNCFYNTLRIECFFHLINTPLPTYLYEHFFSFHLLHLSLVKSNATICFLRISSFFWTVRSSIMTIC